MADPIPAPMVQVPADKVEALREAVANYRTATVARFQMGQTAEPMTEIELAAGALVDAATPAASVPAADILALADHEKSLRELWREAAEKRIEQGVDWPHIVLTLFADIDRAIQQADLWQDKAEIADHERQDWKRWCKEAGALRAAMEAERDALAALVAAAEQADKGEAADTPCDEWDCWCQGTAKGDGHPRCPARAGLPMRARAGHALQKRDVLRGIFTRMPLHPVRPVLCCDEDGCRPPCPGQRRSRSVHG